MSILLINNNIFVNILQAKMHKNAAFFNLFSLIYYMQQRLFVFFAAKKEKNTNFFVFLLFPSRKRGGVFKSHFLLCHGVDKADDMRGKVHFPRFLCAVFAVSHNRACARGELHAYLVRSARVELYAVERARFPFLKLGIFELCALDTT